MKLLKFMLVIAEGKIRISVCQGLQRFVSYSDGGKMLLVRGLKKGKAVVEMYSVYTGHE